MKNKSYNIKIFKDSELINILQGIPSKDKADKLIEKFYSNNSDKLDGVILQIEEKWVEVKYGVYKNINKLKYNK